MTRLKKSTPKQPKPVKRIRPLAGHASADCQEQFDVQIALRATVSKSPKYTASPNVETTFNTWSTSTDKAHELYKGIMADESALKQKYTSLGSLMLQYEVDRDAFLVAVSGVCENDEDARSFGLKTRASRRHIEAGAPDDPHVSFSDVVGDFTVRWTRVDGAGAYIAELSSGPPESEASWEQCYVGSRASFKMTGFALGQKIWFRVRSIGKKMSAWSEPMAVIVR